MAWLKRGVPVVLVVVLCSTVSAQMLVPRTAVDQTDLPPLQVKYQHVTVDVDDQVARTSIEQVFVNNTERDLEASYFFPLPERASIYDFAYYVKGERIAGEIREKGEARRTYDRIVSQMKDPAILEQVGRNLFKAEIYPVSPDEPMKVELRYSEILPYDKGRIRYTYPLAMTGRAVELGELSVALRIADQKRITKLYSETYALDVIRKGDRELVASFEETKVTPEQDLSLVYEVESEDFGVNFVAYRPDATEPGYFMLIMCPQEKTDQADIVKKDVVFVFDRSGSMKGEKVSQAKAAMKYCVESLAEGDRFTVLTFAAETTSLEEKLVPVTDESKRAAGEYIAGLEARGGTAIDDALTAALKAFDDSPAQKTIIFCTDGRPTVGPRDAATIVGHVEEGNAQGVRVFCFGVGDDVDDYLLLKLATDNRGAEQHVKTGESIEIKVGEFYDKVNTPLLVDLELDFGGVSTELVHPRELPDVFKGSQLLVAGRYKKPGATNILLTGDLNGKVQSYERAVTFPEMEAENAFVGRVWARQRINQLVDLMRLEGETEEVKDEIIALSKEWTVQTPYTSFLAIPKEVRDEMRIVTAPPDLPSPVAVTTGGPPGAPGGPRGDTGAGARGAPGGRPMTSDSRALAGNLLEEFKEELADLQGPIDDLAEDVDDLDARVARLDARGPSGPSGPSNPAETVPLDHWYYDAIQKLIDEGVIVGYPRTHEFKGDRPMTRYELAMAISRLMEWRGQVEQHGGEPISRYQAADALANLARRVGIRLDPTAVCPYADVPRDHAQYGDIAALVAADILEPGVSFDGHEPLLREHFAAWAAGLLRVMGLDTTGRDAMQMMADEGILVGYRGGGMQPETPMKRADFTTAAGRLEAAAKGRTAGP